MSLLSQLKNHYIIICSNCDLNVYFETAVLHTSCHESTVKTQINWEGFLLSSHWKLPQKAGVVLQARPYSISQ